MLINNKGTLIVDGVEQGVLEPFPASPPGQTGWPWHKGRISCKSQKAVGSQWPLITVVTPSYNQAAFLEETIRSVLLQGYPNLEYIVMDGGSTDGSIDIIKKYEKYLGHLEIGKDAGQADAIYRGFEMSTGDILAWINSDDYYFPNAFKNFLKAYRLDPGRNLYIGGYAPITVSGKILTKYYSYPMDHQSLLCAGMLFGQMACFWRRDAFFQEGGFDRELSYCFDYDLFLRLTRRGLPGKISKVIAAFRLHDNSKTSLISSSVGAEEKYALQERYGIDVFSEAERRKIINDSQELFTSINRYGLIGDLVDDPIYVARRLFYKSHKEMQRIFGGNKDD